MFLFFFVDVSPVKTKKNIPICRFRYINRLIGGWVDRFRFTPLPKSAVDTRVYAKQEYLEFRSQTRSAIEVEHFREMVFLNDGAP